MSQFLLLVALYGNDVILLFQEGRTGKALNCVNNCFCDTLGFQLLPNMTTRYVHGLFDNLDEVYDSWYFNLICVCF